MAAAQELWKALSWNCSRLDAVGTLEVGRVRHHIFTADLADGCSVSLGRGIVECKWIGWEDLSSTMLKPTAAALLSRDLSALVNRNDRADAELALDTN